MWVLRWDKEAELHLLQGREIGAVVEVVFELGWEGQKESQWWGELVEWRVSPGGRGVLEQQRRAHLEASCGMSCPGFLNLSMDIGPDYSLLWDCPV